MSDKLWVRLMTQALRVMRRLPGFACEERRQLAVDVGELAVKLTDVLCAAGWSEQEARRADVHELSGAAR